MDGCQVGKSHEEIKSIRIEAKSTINEAAYKDLQAFLSTVNGILDVDVDMSKNAIFVDYHPDKITHEKIEQTVADWIGKH